MIIFILRWIIVLNLAYGAGRLITKIRMPSILGWMIVGMLLGPHAMKIMPQSILDAGTVSWRLCGCFPGLWNYF